MSQQPIRFDDGEAYERGMGIWSQPSPVRQPVGSKRSRACASSFGGGLPGRMPSNNGERQFDIVKAFTVKCCRAHGGSRPADC